MMDPLFSIIIPTRNRVFELQRALHSVRGQTFPDFECIVVDDASEPRYNVELTVKLVEDSILFGYIRLKEHSQRCVARNTGMRAAKGDWIAWLDSDDEFASNYLEVVRDAIVDYPDAKCFNFGAIVMHRRREGDWVRYTGTTIRPTFNPVWLGDHHEEFRSGKIGSGSFVFHRDVLDEIEWLPESVHYDHVHRMAEDLHHLYPFPGPPIGNPWGDDYIMFYRITRKFQSLPLPVALYIQHVRV